MSRYVFEWGPLLYEWGCDDCDVSECEANGYQNKAAAIYHIRATGHETVWLRRAQNSYIAEEVKS